MLAKSNAKINIGLSVLSKRNDNYHEISSLFYPLLDYYDLLEIVPNKTSDKAKLTLSGIPIPGEVEANSCLKVYQLLQDKYGIPGVNIHLHKSIPPGSGFGGGSSNAVSSLKVMSELFSLHLDESAMLEIVLQVGSDCPFFVRNEPAVVQGRGEVVKPVAINLDAYQIKVVNTGIHVSTAHVYDNLESEHFDTVFRNAAEMDIREWKNSISNNLEKVVFEQYPELALEKRKLYESGALYASITGSGSGLYGIFSK